MLVEIDDDELVDMLMERLETWTDDYEIRNMFRKMYESYFDCGCWDGQTVNVMEIVDNDWVNYCRVIEETDCEFEELLKIYKEQGLGDCSCETDICSYIEQVNDEEEPKMFLIRV